MIDPVVFFSTASTPTSNPPHIHRLRVTKFNNGFGQFEGKGFAINYLFDVIAYISKWRIEGNSVTFSNKFIKSNFRQIASEKPPLFRTFGGYTPPLPASDRIPVIMSLLNDNLNVNVIKVGSKLFAISDMSGMMELDPLNLNTVGFLKFNDSLVNPLAVITCAHPNQLPGDKYLYNYHVNIMGNMPHVMKMNEYVFYRIDTSKVEEQGMVREAVLKIPVGDGELPYMHSFAQTPNYFVLFKFPLFWDLFGIMGGMDILPDMHWKPQNGTHVLVIDKRTMTVVKEHWTKEVFAYHHMNAFEDNGNVVCDISTVPCNGADPDKGGAECNHMNAFNLATVRNESWNIPNNTIERFTVPVTSSMPAITYRVLTNISFDLQAIHPDKKGQPYRYVWGNGDHGSGTWWSSLVKIDLHTGESLEWYKDDHYASEPNYIPRPGATEEDDGVLIATVLGGPYNHSYLLVLNASTMEELAEADTPHFLPFPSHGFAEIDPV
jgi:beta,beta-carotene 9',10'-dioxygenase